MQPGHCVWLMLALVLLASSASVAMALDSEAAESTVEVELQKGASMARSLKRAPRKVGQLNVDQTALEYMQAVFVSLTDEQGRPKDVEKCPTEVLCLQDKGVVENQQREKPQGAKCTTFNYFEFDWQSAVSGSSVQKSKVRQGILRSYLRVIPRLLPENGSVLVNASVSALLLDTNHSMLVSRNELNVTTDSNLWIEFNITQGLEALWPFDPNTTVIAFTVQFTVDCVTQKKVPVELIDPTEIPLEQVGRRQRHLNLQPLFVLYLDDPFLKFRVMSPDSHSTGEELNIPTTGDMSKRAISDDPDACRMENFTVVFSFIKLNYILFPTQLNIGKCVGECAQHNQKNLPGDLVSNHARIVAQSRVVYSSLGILEGSDVPKEPCCIPKEYDTRYLITQNYHGITLVQLYDEIIVKKCGCS